MPKQYEQEEIQQESGRTPEELSETDRRQIRRLVLQTRPGEHAGRKRVAWIITLESGREVVLILPVDTGRELAKMDGYVGRIRPARDDDHIQIDQPRESPTP